MSKNSKEAKMYPYVKEYLKKRYGCDPVYADLPADKFKVRVPRNLQEREIDVVGVTKRGTDFHVHLAEGKAFKKGTSFEECINQIEAVATYGDYLWVFFPKEEWDRLDAKERNFNEDRIRQKNFGLILVSKGKCEEPIPARPNQSVDAEKREEVLRQIGLVEDNDFPPIETLSSKDAMLAASAVALCTCVTLLFKEGKTSKFTWDYTDHEYIKHGWFSPSWDCGNNVIVEMDPFGRYLMDGKPVAWVFIEYDEKGLNSFLLKEQTFGTHCFFDNEKWSWKTIPLADLSKSVISNLKQQGYDSYIGHAVDLVGRNPNKLKDELKRLIGQAKKLSA